MKMYGGGYMETKDILLELRRKKGLSQEELAAKLFVTRQAVSRWETGETIPNIETLKLLSKLFNASINTLLGSPRQLICQCCGMPLEDEIIGKDKDGMLNEDYCKWCYADGTYTYNNMDDLIDVCVKHMVNESFTEEQARAYMKQMLPQLDYWKRYEELSDNGKFDTFKKNLIEEINGLHIEGMPKLEKLNALVGKYVNLDYRLPNGKIVKFLDDNTTGDGLLSGLHLLQVMKETGRKLSELAEVMEVLPQALVNAKVPNHKKEKFMEYTEIAEAIKALEEKFNGEGRVLIRPSGTEPLVRVMIEGKNQSEIEEEAQKLAELITNTML